MKLIKINNTDHYVVVDDSEITTGDIVAEKLLTDKYELFTIHTLNDIDKQTQKKITHSTQPLDVIILKNRDHSQSVGQYYGNGGQLSLQEVKELIGEVDVKEESSNFNERHWQKYWENTLKKESCATNGKRDVYIAGYNQAIEDNKEKKYTDEDMLNAAKYGYEFRDTTSFPEHKFEDSCINNTKQWLQCYSEPKTEWEVEIIDGKLKLKN